MGAGGNLRPHLDFMTHRICLDVDGVICDIADSIETSLEKLGHKGYDYSSWLTSYSDDPLMKEVMDNEQFWLNLKPLKISWHIINKWWMSGYGIHFITSRYSQHSQRALSWWLESWEVAHSSLHFVGMGSKWDQYEKLNGVVFVDDNPKEIKIACEKGVNAFLMKAWYNSEYWDTLPSIDDLSQIDLTQFERS